MIRKFIKEVDDSAWANLEGIDLDEFKESEHDPEFSYEGMLVARAGFRRASTKQIYCHTNRSVNEVSD